MHRSPYVEGRHAIFSWVHSGPVSFLVLPVSVLQTCTWLNGVSKLLINASVCAVVCIYSICDPAIERPTFTHVNWDWLPLQSAQIRWMEGRFGHSWYHGLVLNEVAWLLHPIHVCTMITIKTRTYTANNTIVQYRVATTNQVLYPACKERYTKTRQPWQTAVWNQIRTQYGVTHNTGRDGSSVLWLQ